MFTWDNCQLPSQFPDLFAEIAAISFPFLLAKNSKVPILGPGVQTFNQVPGRADDNGLIYLYFPTSSIERIYYFEILMFRDSIEVYFNSPFLILLKSVCRGGGG